MQSNRVKLLAMKIISGYALLSAIFATALDAQTQAPLAATPQPNHTRGEAKHKRGGFLCSVLP